MKKFLGVVMMVSLLVTTCSCTPMAYSVGAYVTNSDVIIYTVERIIFLGHSEISTNQDIIFTKVFSKNKSTQQTKLLFELQEKIYDCHTVNGSIYLLTTAGIYKSNINGENMHILLGGNIKSFTVNDDNIFYCLYNDDIQHFQIMKCDFSGNNKAILASKVIANKLTVINGDLIYSGMSGVGKISGTNQITYITNSEVPMPGGWERDGGRHFVIDKKIIISGYATPEEYKEYGSYPTIILDLTGKVLNVWENCFIRDITKVEDNIYASIDNMRNNGGNTITSNGIYHIIDDFKEKQLASDDVLQNGTTENIVAEQYSDAIVVVILRENITGSAAKYCSELVAFDVSPTMENNRVFVPMRAIFEALGATVDWDNDTQTVTAKKDSTEISLKIGSSILCKNGEEIALDVPAKIVNNRTLVPIRAVCEGLGAQVEWNETVKAVYIWAD